MNRRAIGLAALATVLWSVVMMLVFPYPCEHSFHHDLDSPILALELAHNQGDIDAVLKCSPKSIQWNTILDLVFIPLYIAYLVLLGRSRWVTILALGAGLFDYIEDGFIFLALSGGSPPVYLPSLAKWGLLALTLLRLATRLNLYSLATNRLLGLAHGAAGAIMLLGVILGEWIGYSWIELGAKIFAFTILVNAVSFLCPLIGRWFHESQPEPLDDFCSQRGKGSKPVIH